MSEANINIPLEYKVNWLDIVLLVAKLGPEKIKLLDPNVRHELFGIYYDGLNENKANGFITNEMIIKKKPNLYNYLKKIGIVEIYSKEEHQQVKKIVRK